MLTAPIDDRFWLVRGVEEHRVADGGGIGHDAEVHSGLGGAGDGAVQYVGLAGTEGE
jgi:hypothetical protein